MDNNSTDHYHSTDDYLKLVFDILAQYPLFSRNTISGLLNFAIPIYRSELENKYSKPMLWIGMYIALASLLCILAMLADLLHGLRNRKFWIPCKYFSINSTSLLLISVAMKLPVDLTGAMPGDVDQAAKLGSLAFMCIMMANLLPSLASMDWNELLTNITALVILVITLVVNVCIQINTGVVSVNERAKLMDKFPLLVKYLFTRLDSLGVSASNKHRNGIIATLYVVILLVLLIIHVCSSLAILKSKQIIESKYQQRRHETALEHSARRLLSVEKLHQHVRNYWIMAGSGSPQFIAACSVTTTASGVICVVPTVLHTLTMSSTIRVIMLEMEKDYGSDNKWHYGSDYKWSMLVILIVQFIGVIVGTIAPFCRCFATLSFKVSIKSISTRITVFKFESYWSAKLLDWKQGRVPFPVRNHNFKVIIQYSRNLILNFCIKLQETVVVVCKLIAVIPFSLMICAWYCFHCFKLLLKTTLFRSQGQIETLEQNTSNLTRYVLQLEDEMELAERSLKGLLKTLNRVIQKGEKKQPNNLKSLILEKSTSGFQQVLNFDDIDQVPSLLSKDYQSDSWSLPVVTLTIVAISLPDIEKEQVDSLLKSVREGLEYVTLVEESLLINAATDDYASVRKAAETSWLEVDVQHKWLGNDLQKPLAAFSTCDQVDKTRQVIEWFRDTAKKMVTSPAVGSTDIGGPSNDDSTLIKSICANSVYRVTETFFLSYQASIDNQKPLFDKLSTMIADLIAACLTNLPQVIIMKCHTSAIEKREASIRAAAQLLGETKQIITVVQERQPLDMEPNDFPFMGKWRAYLADLRNP